MSESCIWLTMMDEARISRFLTCFLKIRWPCRLISIFRNHEIEFNVALQHIKTLGIIYILVYLTKESLI